MFQGVRFLGIAILITNLRVAIAETPAEHLLALVEAKDLNKIAAYLAQPGVGVDDRPGVTP